MSKFEETRSIEQKERAVKEAERKKAAWARSNSDMKVTATTNPYASDSA